MFSGESFGHRGEVSFPARNLFGVAVEVLPLLVFQFLGHRGGRNSHGTCRCGVQGMTNLAVAVGIDRSEPALNSGLIDNGFAAVIEIKSD